MDMTYATIPVFSQPRRLYRETHMKYMVSSQERPENAPIYSIHIYLDSFVLYNDEIPYDKELVNEASTNIMVTPHPNIVAAIEEKERKEKSLD